MDGRIVLVTNRHVHAFEGDNMPDGVGRAAFPVGPRPFTVDGNTLVFSDGSRVQLTYPTDALRLARGAGCDKPE
jgi:hypothetical protein